MHKGTNKKGAISAQWLIESIVLLFCLAVILAVVANATPTGVGRNGAAAGAEPHARPQPAAPRPVYHLIVT